MPSRRLGWLGVISPGQMLRRRVVRYGFVEGEWLWRIIGLFVFGRPILRKILGRESQFVAIEQLSPGNTLQITAIPYAGSSRRRRRR